MALVRQSVKKVAKNKNGAKYRKKYSIKQTVKSSNNRITTKYTFSKKIIKSNKYRYA